VKIGIDATSLNQHRTGTVTYVTEILDCWNRDKTIAHQFLLFVTAKNQHHFERLELDARFTLVRAPTSRMLRLLWQQTAMVWHLSAQKVSVHWGATFVLPWWSPCPCVVTVHDMTFDLFAQAHERIKRLYFPRMIRLAVQRARTVIAISNNTAHDLARLIPPSANKTEVTLLAASTPGKRSLASTPIEPPFVLSVGTLEPRKNIPRLIQAWQQLTAEQKQNHRLLLVGAIGWLVEDVQASVKDDPSVVLAGHLGDDELQACLQAATAFVYPSLYEGFGLPILEAMLHGLPVLTSRSSATGEIAGDAALLIDPYSVDEIGHGIAQLIADPLLRTDLADAGQRRAATFSWSRAANQTLQVLQKAAAPDGGC
jgi:glycosyltransferase involved in cell wall biosynthesis